MTNFWVDEENSAMELAAMRDEAMIEAAEAAANAERDAAEERAEEERARAADEDEPTDGLPPIEDRAAEVWIAAYDATATEGRRPGEAMRDVANKLSEWIAIDQDRYLECLAFLAPKYDGDEPF